MRHAVRRHRRQVARVVHGARRARRVSWWRRRPRAVALQDEVAKLGASGEERLRRAFNAIASHDSGQVRNGVAREDLVSSQQRANCHNARLGPGQPDGAPRARLRVHGPHGDARRGRGHVVRFAAAAASRRADTAPNDGGAPTPPPLTHPFVVVPFRPLRRATERGAAWTRPHTRSPSLSRAPWAHAMVTSLPSLAPAVALEQRRPTDDLPRCRQRFGRREQGRLTLVRRVSAPSRQGSSRAAARRRGCFRVRTARAMVMCSRVATSTRMDSAPGGRRGTSPHHHEWQSAPPSPPCWGSR